jgi:hypothetical protein
MDKSSCLGAKIFRNESRRTLLLVLCCWFVACGPMNTENPHTAMGSVSNGGEGKGLIGLLIRQLTVPRPVLAVVAGTFRAGFLAQGGVTSGFR